MSNGNITQFGVGGIDVSTNEGLSRGLSNLNLTGTQHPAPTTPTAPQGAPTGLDKIREFFPGFRMYSAEELKAASTEELTKIFNDLNGNLERANALRVQVQTQIEGKEEERKKIVAEVQERFGVSTVEELLALREKELACFAELMEQLKQIV